MNEELRQVSESLKMVFDLTSRVDERLKILVEQHNESTERIDKIMDRQEHMVARISVLENKNGHTLAQDIKELDDKQHDLEVKVASLSMMSEGHEAKWKTAVDFVFKITMVALGAVLAWKLGVK